MTRHCHLAADGAISVEVTPSLPMTLRQRLAKGGRKGGIDFQGLRNSKGLIAFDGGHSGAAITQRPLVPALRKGPELPIRGGKRSPSVRASKAGTHRGPKEIQFRDSLTDSMG